MDINTARTNMIKQQLRTNQVLDNDLLDLLESVPREMFVPEDWLNLAYSDSKIPLAHDQHMMTPLEEASILTALAIKPSDVVLEVGTGSGYLTALMAKLAKKVYSIEYYADLSEQAQIKLQQLGIDNVEYIIGDGSRGYLDPAPFDAIVFTGSLPSLPDIVQPQVLDGGRIFALLGEAPVVRAILLTQNHNQWQQETLFETYVEPLIYHQTKDPFVF